MARPLGTYSGQPNGYYEYLPPNYGTGLSPLLVCWHGVGANGNGTSDLWLVADEGLTRMLRDGNWSSDQPFVILSPQYSGSGKPPASEIRDFFTFALQHYSNIDLDCVYLTGYSSGAEGSWDYLGQYLNDVVAAAVLICGRGINAWNQAGTDLGSVAIWGFHGAEDRTVDPSGTIIPMNNLMAIPESQRQDQRMNIYPGVGHESWNMTYDLSSGNDIYTWLLQQVKTPVNDAPVAVDNDYSVNEDHILQ